MINIGGVVQQGEDPITERGDGRRRGVEHGILPAGVFELGDRDGQGGAELILHRGDESHRRLPQSILFAGGPRRIEQDDAMGQPAAA